MKRALVTGGSGFIGGHLVEALRRLGVQVRCLLRPSSSRTLLEGLDVEFAVGDVTRLESLPPAIADVDLVFHLAGLRSAATVGELTLVNETGTLNVVRACADQPRPPVLIHVSSVAAAGPANYGQVRGESEPPRPVSNYGRSKLAGERAVRAFADRVPATIVRPGIVFGPRCQECRPIFRAIYRTGIHPVVGWQTPPLSLVHIDDLIAVLLAAAEKGARLAAGVETGRGCYFACADEHPTYAELGRWIGEVWQRRVLVLPVAQPLPWVLGATCDVLRRLHRRIRLDTMGIDKIREATAKSWACSPAAAERELGVTPTSSLRERLRETAEWYLAEGWL